MSYRERSRISGYRSQPVSNRTSLYLSSDFNVGLTEDYTDFDRQFKKLLERTETFTNRVERLQSTSSYLKKGFRGVDTTFTRLRGQRDAIGSTYGNIESRIFSDEGDSTTEEEWKRLLDAGRLIEKAVELVRQRYRYPKPLFEYSPESPSPQAYDPPSGIILLPNPRSPRDKEGKRIRDLGSEIKDHDTASVVGGTSTVGNTNVQRTDRAPSAKRFKKGDLDKSKSLQSLKEMDEDVLVDKPNLRSRLASQKSKDELKSDNESKQTSETETTSQSKRTIEERRQTTKSLIETVSKPTSEAADTPPRKSRLLEDRRNSTKSLVEAEKSKSPLSDRRQSTKSVLDSTRFSTAEDSTSSLRNNLSHSTISLYSTDRFKTRSERLKDASKSSLDKTEKSEPRSERFKDYTTGSDRPRSSAFRSESVFADRIENDSPTSAHEESDDKSKDSRRPSFLKTLKNAANRSKKRPTSSIYEETLGIKREQRDEAQRKSLLSPAVDENTLARRKSTDHLIYTNAELIKMAQDDLEKGKKGKKIEESITPTLKKKTPSSSSFHEYNPDKRVPLKERLKNKMSETSTSTEDDTISPVTPLAQRASRLSREKTAEKDDSLRSRFLRRFRLGSDEKGDEKKETSERRSRKKSSQDEDSNINSKKQGKHNDDEKPEVEPSRYKAKEQVDPSSYDTYSTRALKLSMDHRMTSIELEMEKTTSLSEILKKEEETAAVDLSKYNVYSYRSRRKLKELEEAKSADSRSPKLEKQKSIESRSPLDRQKSNEPRSPLDRQKSNEPRSPLGRQKSSDSLKSSTNRSRTNSKNKEENVDKPSPRTLRQKQKEKMKKEAEIDEKIIKPLKERRKEKDSLKEPKSEFVREDIPSPKGVLRRLNPTYAFDKEKEKEKQKEKQKAKKDVTKLDMLDRKSLYIDEDEIKPVIIKSEDIKVEFKSPHTSVSDEVVEQIVASEIMDRPIQEDFFKVLLQREVSEEEVSMVGTAQDKSDNILDNLFNRMKQMPGESRPMSLALSEVSGKNRESVCSELSIVSSTTSFDESSESSDVFVNGKRSSSSADLFAKIEKANNKLYSGLLSLTSKVNDGDSETTVDEGNDSGDDGKGPKSNTTTNLNVHNSADQNNEETNVTVDGVPEADIPDHTTVKLTENTLQLSPENIPILNGSLDENLADQDSVPNETSVKMKEEVTEDMAVVHLRSNEIVPTTVTEEMAVDQSETDEISVSKATDDATVDQLNPGETSPTMLQEERLDPSPFKLKRTKKVDDNTPVVGVTDQNVIVNSKGGSFDKVVDETTEDVNKMLSNCNSIDRINDDIQRAHSSSTKGAEGPSPDLIDRAQSASPNRKRSSYLEKRASHMKFFQSDLSVSNEDVRNLNDNTKSSKESLDNNPSEAVELVIKKEADELLAKTSRDSSVEESVLQDIIDSVEENITLDTLTIKPYDDTQGENEDESEIKAIEMTDTQTINTCDDTPVQGENEDVSKMTDTQRDELNNVDQIENGNNSRKPVLNSSKSLEECERNDMSTSDTKAINKAKLAALRSTQSVEVKSLEEIRTRLDEIKTHSSTSSLVNVNAVVENKAPTELKSLNEIKNRLNEIKARKKQLKLLEINKNLSVDKDAGVTPRVTDVSVTQTRKVKLNDHAESESENDKVNVEYSYESNIILSPIRKIKLSNDFLEEMDEEPQVVQDVHILENGVFDDDTDTDKINTNGLDKSEITSQQDEVVCNGTFFTSIISDESVVRESIENLIDKIVTNNNEDSILAEGKIEIKTENEAIEMNGVTSPLSEQQNQNNSNEIEIMSESRDKKHGDSPVSNTGDEKRSAHLPGTIEDDDTKVYLNGHSIETFDADGKTWEDASSPSLLSDDAVSLSLSATSDTTTVSKTKDTQRATNGHATKAPKFIIPRQMSIVEYRRQKLEKHSSEPLFHSDEDVLINKSDNDNHKGHKSSVADVSDTSDDCRERKKYYRHSKRDIRISGDYFRSSASEDSDEEEVSIVDRLANRFIQRTRLGSNPNNNIPATADPTEKLNRSVDSSRNKNLTQKFNERYKANGNV